MTFGDHPLPVVGRERELARLDAVLRAAAAGTGAALVVEGPAGIGKTRLLAVARERAAGEGMTVLHARGTPLEREYAMGVVRQAYEPSVRAAERHDRLFAGAAGLARGVLLEGPGERAAAPVGVLHGLYWLTASLADRAPLLLAVDDAHWADEPSLRFLAYLARRVESHAIALVVCARHEQQGIAADMLREIGADPATEVVQPQPLPVTGVEALLTALDAGAVAEPFARACHDATGGNPFLLAELIRALHADRVPFTARGAARIRGVAPRPVAQMVRATLDRLGPSARAIARAAAILGEDARLDAAAALERLSMTDAAAAAGALVRAGVLEDTQLLRFRHPIVADAVGADLTTAERADGHRRAADLLRARGAEPERVALQLLHAPPAGDERVVVELRLAAERARARGAQGTTTSLLRRALAEPPVAHVRGDLLLELGGAEYASGETGVAATHLEEAARCAPDPATRARALLALVQASPYDARTHRSLSPLIAPTVAELEPRDGALAQRLRLLIMLMAPPGPELDAAIRECRRLDGATPGEAAVMAYLLMPLIRDGATATEIAAVAERAAPQADALLSEGATALVIVGIALSLRWTDRLDAAERLLDRVIDSARRRGSAADFAIASTHRAGIHRRAGRLLVAEADARDALAAGVERGWLYAGPPGVIPLIGCLADQGRGEEAARELAAAHGDDELPDDPAMTPLLLERMRLRVVVGEPRLAVADWEEARRRAGRLFGVNPGWIGDLVVAAEAHHALGERDAAVALADEALTLARRWDTPGAIGQALHAGARLGRAEQAVDVLRSAVDQLERSPARVEHARALIALGGTLRRGGHRADSRVPLREGYELAQRGGAAALAELARSELRASGIRLRREALTGASSLTASERRIAEMAAAGASNAGIAQDLFLTVKTVEMHLTHAYRKLDIGGRPGLAEALAGEPQGRGPGSAP
ncbi:AAA family ATPase [Conexibacter stalactiti]|uniref:AAA family ATPase n=1 Tax=Conexibacter stalactiti TaxID=1940611 RepID=A0ABU4HQ86_9ACTN|nr:AAA family ATPase [Conexibacter stalactiti]MDW5595465.1 AAA family ATPase [Conexibacter stalactiti]MEC5036107.1 AAA family ATPase [Conexibacter stalactiti]